MGAVVPGKSVKSSKATITLKANGNNVWSFQVMDK